MAGRPLRRLRMNPQHQQVRWTPYEYTGIIGEIDGSPLTFKIHEDPPRLEVIKHLEKCEAQDEYTDTQGMCSCPGELYGPFRSVYEAMYYADLKAQGRAKHLERPLLIKKMTGYR